MQTYINKDTESRLNLIAGLINRSQKKAVVSTESLIDDMIKYGIESYFRGDVELIKKKGEVPDAHSE